MQHPTKSQSELLTLHPKRSLQNAMQSILLLTLRDLACYPDFTNRAQWTDKSKVVKDQEGKIRYITYYDLDQLGYRCAVGKVWITSEVA